MLKMALDLLDSYDCLNALSTHLQHVIDNLALLPPTIVKVNKIFSGTIVSLIFMRCGDSQVQDQSPE